MLDRTLTLFFNGSQSLYMDGLAWTATQTSTWLPLAVIIFYVFLRNNTLNGTIRIVLAFALCILLADQVASTIFKPMVARWRPTNNPEFMYMVDVVRGYRGGNYGYAFFVVEVLRCCSLPAVPDGSPSSLQRVHSLLRPMVYA